MIVNKDLTEEQLDELYHAFCAVGSKRDATIYTLSVFRNIITYKSMVDLLVNKAREVFNIPIAKGNLK